MVPAVAKQAISTSIMSEGTRTVRILRLILNEMVWFHLVVFFRRKGSSPDGVAVFSYIVFPPKFELMYSTIKSMSHERITAINE